MKQEILGIERKYQESIQLTYNHIVRILMHLKNIRLLKKRNLRNGKGGYSSQVLLPLDQNLTYSKERETMVLGSLFI